MGAFEGNFVIKLQATLTAGAFRKSRTLIANPRDRPKASENASVALKVDRKRAESSENASVARKSDRDRPKPSENASVARKSDRDRPQSSENASVARKRGPQTSGIQRKHERGAHIGTRPAAT